MASASAFVPVWDRAAEWERRLAMVRGATRFLYLSTFYIEPDDYGLGMLDALTEARTRGVYVDLLIDGFGQRLGGVLMTPPERARLDAAIARLRAGGGIVSYYRPPRLTQRWLGGGQHVKIQVSDAGEALVGSSNLTRSSFTQWNECSVAVRGGIVPTVLASYALIGGDVRHEDHAVLKILAEADPGTLTVDYWCCNPNRHQGALGPLGWRGENRLTRQLCTAIDDARQSLSISSFYFKPVPALMEAVLRAARRGVAVEVFHSHRDALPATDLAWIAAAVSYPALLDAGVQVYENRRGEHSKMVAIDDTWVALGSYNFEDAAHDRLAEAMLVTCEPAAVAHTGRLFAALRAAPDNDRVTAETVAAWSPAVRRRVARLGHFKRWM